MSLDSTRYSSAQISWAVSTHTTLHSEMEGGGGERNGRWMGVGMSQGCVITCVCTCVARAVHVPVWPACGIML